MTAFAHWMSCRESAGVPAGLLVNGHDLLESLDS